MQRPVNPDTGVKKMEEQFSFEEGIHRIEEILDLLEKKQSDLSRSLALYEEGMELLNRCSEILDKAEQKVEILKNSYAESPSLAEYSGEESDED